VNLWEDAGRRGAGARTLARLLRLAVVSNTNGTPRSLLGRVGLAPRIDLVVDSFEKGEADHGCSGSLDKAGGAESTVHAGDLFHADVVGSTGGGPARRPDATTSPDCDRFARVRSSTNWPTARGRRAF
jgi:hypothetical protein